MQYKIPTILLDEEKCQKNIIQMFEKARKNQILFRPHFKTHQSAEIGEWFKGLGISSITVSSVQMAIYFANAGWNDILIAFPVNILEIDEINILAEKVTLHLLLESVESTKFLINNLKFKSGIYLKIDTGYNRTGISPDEEIKIKEITYLIKTSTNLELSGVLAHAGHAYESRNNKEIQLIHKRSVQQLHDVKKIVAKDYTNCKISVGDTPTCSLVTDFTGVNEIRPGNFVFYDAMQYYLGSCHYNQIAVALACPVVAKHKSRNEIVIYGGAIHLSKDFTFDQKGRKIFGLVVKLKNGSWDKPLSETYISKLSQEHGIIKTTEEIFAQIKIGETIGILPVHSCLTSNLMNNYTTVSNRKITKFKLGS